MMTIMDRLNLVRAAAAGHHYEYAAKKIDELYEEYTQSKIRMTKEEEDYMYILIDWISTKLYG